ncbi:hypothetical protein EVAR_21093_1 [Eumeta japonica]|uniref:Uncharacterized protein n=1 Tax=Eumeta variegata TaxID=151549 RepID=A0A4C1V0N9_EUMVA|nr:hypothetical protein EVAR_21093_1 [Eumeta japonica]
MYRGQRYMERERHLSPPMTHTAPLTRASPSGDRILGLFDLWYRPDLPYGFLGFRPGPVDSRGPRLSQLHSKYKNKLTRVQKANTSSSETNGETPEAVSNKSTFPASALRGPSRLRTRRTHYDAAAAARRLGRKTRTESNRNNTVNHPTLKIISRLGVLTSHARAEYLQQTRP